MAIRPVLIGKESPFLGENCALCKEPFNPGEEIIVCPEDATRHHVRCWRANGNRCTAYGCEGQGRPISRPRLVEVEREQLASRQVVEREPAGRERASKVRAMPSSSFSCAQSCLLLSLAFAIVVLTVSCFGLWAIADFVMMEVLGWEYREPLSYALPAGLVLISSLPLSNGGRGLRTTRRA